MVDRINGNGQHFRSVIREHGLTKAFGYRTIRLRDVADQAQMLNELAQKPEFDAQSFLISDASTGNREPRNVLVVPEDCPRLFGTAPETTPGLNAGETFVVEAWDRIDPARKKTYFCIAGDEDQAERIARAAAGSKFGAFGNNIKVNRPILVEPEEFRLLVRKAINRGQEVPTFILKKAGLWEYAQEVRNNGKS